MSNSYSEKTDPSSIYTHFNTCYVIPLFSYTDTLLKWSQMRIINLEFPIFWYETFFMFKTNLLLLNFCLCVYYWYNVLQSRTSVCCILFHLSAWVGFSSSISIRKIIFQNTSDFTAFEVRRNVEIPFTDSPLPFASLSFRQLTDLSLSAIVV